jgi:hypothetical protein
MMSRHLSILAAALLIACVSGCSKEESKEPPKAVAPPAASTAAAPPASGPPVAIFNALITVDNPVRELTAGQTAAMPVTVKNTSSLSWPWSPPSGEPSGTVRLAYHWLQKSDGKPVVWDGLRTVLPKSLGPGEVAVVASNVKAPDAKGSYLLAFDLVVDGPGGSWFSSKGPYATQIDVAVK